MNRKPTYEELEIFLENTNDTLNSIINLSIQTLKNSDYECAKYIGDHKTGAWTDIDNPSVPVLQSIVIELRNKSNGIKQVLSDIQ